MDNLKPILKKVVPLTEKCKLLQGWRYCIDGSNHARQKASYVVLWVSAVLMSQIDGILMYGKNLGNYYFFLSLWLTSLHQMALYSTEPILNSNFIDIAVNAFCICTGFNICFGTIVL